MSSYGKYIIFDRSALLSVKIFYSDAPVFENGLLSVGYGLNGSFTLNFDPLVENDEIGYRSESEEISALEYPLEI